MNYIKQLQLKVTELEAAIESARLEVYAFRLHLASDKFTGVESDGERKDWIATADVFERLRMIGQWLERG